MVDEDSLGVTGDMEEGGPGPVSAMGVEEHLAAAPLSPAKVGAPTPDALREPGTGWLELLGAIQQEAENGDEEDLPHILDLFGTASSQ